MNKPRQIQTAFRMPPIILDALRRVSKEDEIGISEFVRNTLRAELIKRGALAPPSRKPRKQRKK